MKGCNQGGTHSHALSKGNTLVNMVCSLCDKVWKLRRARLYLSRSQSLSEILPSSRRRQRQAVSGCSMQTWAALIFTFKYQTNKRVCTKWQTVVFAESVRAGGIPECIHVAGDADFSVRCARWTPNRNAVEFTSSFVSSAIIFIPQDKQTN